MVLRSVVAQLLLAFAFLTASLFISGCNDKEGFLSQSNDVNETEELSPDDEVQLDFAENGLLSMEEVEEGTEAELEAFMQRLLEDEQGGEGSYADARPPKCCSSEPTTQMTWAEFEQTPQGAAVANGGPVEIPCEFEVSVTSGPSGPLGGLEVKGHLKFENTVDVSLTSAYIFVCGSFSIGTEEQGHESNVEIVLDGKFKTGNENFSWPRMHTGPETLDFGTAGFITYGGNTVIRGASCGGTSWANIAKPVAAPSPISGITQISQSSLSHSKYVAENAVDGDTDTSMLTEEETRPWWQMNLPSSVQEGIGIVRINLHSRTSTHVWFFTSSSPTRLSTIENNVYDGVDQGAIVGLSHEPCGNDGLRCSGDVCGTITKPREDGRYEIDCQGKTGRYLYVLLPGSNRQLQLAEVSIFTSTVPSINIELAKNAQPSWKAGERLVITSSSLNAFETEEITVSGKVGNTFQASGVRFHHDGCDLATDPDCYASAEVASISRNIVIRGSSDCNSEICGPLMMERQCKNTKPRCGHFMIAHTNKAFVCGAEFTNLGQPGFEGRYPLHIHMPGTAPELIIKDNALHHNHQRGVVMHGVIGGIFQSNVCYLTNGHCFMFEDGGEVNNLVINNIMILPRPLRFRCTHSHDFTFTCPARSDHAPNAIWIPNTNNFIVGNVGVVPGIVYRIETRHVMGLTRLKFPKEAVQIGGNGKLKGCVPIGSFKNNVAHSSRTGWFNYPRFMPTAGKIEGLLSWRNDIGISIHNDARKALTIEGARLMEVALAARGGTGTARISLEKSQMKGRYDRTSGPFGVKGINKNWQSIKPVYQQVDAYSRNWARCFGKYRLTDIDTRAKMVLTQSFQILEDPAYQVACDSITEDMPPIINPPEPWPQSGESHTRCEEDNIVRVSSKLVCQERAVRLKYPIYMYYDQGDFGKCAAVILCARVTGTGYDWRVYQNPEFVPPVVSTALWPQDGGSHTRCEKAGTHSKFIKYAADQAACQVRATTLGHAYYQYEANEKKCGVASSCDDTPAERISGTAYDWRIYKLPESGEDVVLWSQDGDGHSRCTAKQIVDVANQKSCQQRADMLGNSIISTSPLKRNALMFLIAQVG